MEKSQSEGLWSRGLLAGLLNTLPLVALPIAVWLDLKNLVEMGLRRQAADLNSVVSSVRAYYAANVVGRILAHPGSTQVVRNYEEIPEAIPIPATCRSNSAESLANSSKISITDLFPIFRSERYAPSTR